MLFNSYEFLFIFLPATLVGFFALSGLRRFGLAAGWLALASIWFYGYWNPRYVLLLGTSIVLNFFAGQAILRYRSTGALGLAQQVLILALIGNLATLGYFKYANFFVDALDAAAGTGFHLGHIVLPLGISFFTFTQIAFLVDAFQGKVPACRFGSYTLFVTFYPHLIAGPVLHHAEMMPQFERAETYRFRLDNFLIGATFLSIGLFKKVVLADGIQPFVGPVFEADPGYPLTALEAWGGVLAYTLQLYFDFSGYSDMAIGLAKMTNIDLPLNFNSPYKAMNIAEFWRRWHMTLSRFLRDYLYIPLGGNRKGPLRRYLNLLITMLLGGLWHGAGWTFVIWGALHGVFLMVHQVWNAVFVRKGRSPSLVGRAVSTAFTFLCVVAAWVFFRATSIEAAFFVCKGMLGMNGVLWPDQWQGAAGTLGARDPELRWARLEAFGGWRQWAWIVVLLAIAWAAPNSQTLVARLKTRAAMLRHERWAWMALGGLAVCVFLLAAINASRGSSEFIYFNF